jgi:proteasome lid subunit RPN8/RPN11
MPGTGGKVTRVVEMQNAERSPTGFTWEPGEQLRVFREMDDRDEDLLVVYHSHTMTEAAPSRTDVRFAVNTTGPDVHWLIVSTREEDVTEVRSFHIADDGTISEEEVSVVDG